MYSEWASVQQEIQGDTGNKSVLHCFPQVVGKDVASVVVRNLAQSLNLGASNGEPSPLKTDKEVRWTMEVLCYGLSLPLSDHEAIRDCVNVYCEWLSALTVAKVCVPRPIEDDPNTYACIMLHHLYNLFVPRTDLQGMSAASSKTQGSADLVKRQALLCHRLLRAVQTAAKDSNNLSRETWETLLKFLLAVNDTLLAPPLIKGSDSIGEQLCERVLSVLFEMWLLACVRCFPSPPLWKTFRDMCSMWRHHEALIAQWHRVNTSLTSRLIKVMYGPDYPELYVPSEDMSFVEGMENDCLAQCWFRFLHTLSNPVDLCHPEIISNTPKFLHMALTSESVVDPHQHECLRTLPHIFFRAMKGISTLVDAFLGISEIQPDPEVAAVTTPGTRSTLGSSSTLYGSNTSITPPQQRKAKAFSLKTDPYSSKGGSKAGLLTPAKQVGSTSTTPSSSPLLVTLNSRPPLALMRPKVNSILHLFGSWLVEAALAGVKVHGSEQVDGTSSDSDVAALDYEAGRAEACGTLCRLFCSHRTGETILPAYLSRFYITLYYGLQPREKSNGQTLANVIFNSCDLLRVDLDGVMILVPHILKALELILSELNTKLRLLEQIPTVELRKASIHLLLSMLSLPLHFKTLPIRHIFGEVQDPPVTFLSLKMRMIELLLRALLIETDSENTQMLLGGLMLSVQDLALCEEAEQTTVQDEQGGPPSPSTMESTGSDHSMTKGSGGSGQSGSGKKRLQKPASISWALSEAGNPLYDLGIPQSSTHDLDSAFGLFGHAASLVCNRLMASWKMDLNIALAAIEVLTGLAKVKLNKPNLLMCKRTVNWICELIVYQCSRPAPAHSKDLHSMIVAAFQCVTLWLTEHDYLLADKECLHCVLEVVELGISGAKSQQNWPDGHLVAAASESSEVRAKHDKGHARVHVDSEDQNRASDIPKLKGEKELKPVSMRVKDAAEGLLTAIMDHVGSFPPPCGPESVCSLLDEESLLKYCKDGGLTDKATPFRYFVLDGTTIVGLLEQPLGNDQDPLPTVTALIRGPFGRHAWTMQLRHLPRHKKVASKMYLSEPSRPEPDDNVGVVHNVKHHCFPEIVDTVPLVKADKSIPLLEPSSAEQAAELDKLTQFIQDQVAFENKIKARVEDVRKETPCPNPETECKPPSICHEFQTARLFLSHYGFLSLEALKEQSSSVPPSLLMLDGTATGMLADLEQLDSIPCRTTDTVFAFYVKSGQKMPWEILSNVTSKMHVQPTFLEFLQSLGWPVDVKKHAGWTGHTSTSWKIMPTDEEDEFYPGDTGGSLYDGRKQVLYWADVIAEVAFVVPSPDTYQPQERRNSLDSNPVEPARLRLLTRRRSRTTLEPLLLAPDSPAAMTTPSLLAGAMASRSPPLSPRWARSPPLSPRRVAVGSSSSKAKVLPTSPPATRLHRSAPRDKIQVTSSAGSTPVDPTGPTLRTDRPTARAPDLASTKHKSLSLDLEQPPTRPASGNRQCTTESPVTPTADRIRRSGRFPSVASIPDTKIFVVWLESFEDHENFPAGDLLPSTSTGIDAQQTSTTNLNRQAELPIYIIFIHALANGLFRIHLQGHPSRISLAIPLVDGMVVSRRCLGTLVRQTAINICRRRRLENDAYQPPHVRRKLKIKEIVDKYRSKMNEPEFYTALFQDVNK